MDDTDITMSAPGTDGLSLFREFQFAMFERRPVPDHVLQWLHEAFVAWGKRSGNEGLEDVLGLREALKADAAASRIQRYKTLLFTMDMLVFLGARPEDAAAIVAESLEPDDALSASTLEYKFKSKRVRPSADAMRMRLAGRGGPKRFLAAFKDTYMPPTLLSMKRRL